MKKNILYIALFATIALHAQTAEELKASLALEKSAIAKLQKKANGIQKKLNALPGWRYGAFGTIGGNLSGFSNWYSKEAPNSAAGNIGFTVNGYANLIQKKFFWRNATNINLAWVKFDNKDNATDSESFESATDVFNITSLYGRNISAKWAVSALGEYRTTLINNFNNPGYLDFGVGLTWTPISNLVVVIHPGNYNFIFSSEDTVFESSLGSKIVGDYSTKIAGVNIKSNLSLFQSYNSSNLSNWTWINSFGYTLWKGIGLGFEFGLRNNKQEALYFARKTNTAETFESVDNQLQTYYLVGLNYNF